MNQDPLKEMVLEKMNPDQVRRYAIAENYDIVFKRYIEDIGDYNIDDARNRTINFFLNLVSYYNILKKKMKDEEIKRNGYEVIYNLMILMNYLKQYHITITHEDIQKIIQMMKKKHSIKQIQQSFNTKYGIHGAGLRYSGSITIPQDFSKTTLLSKKKENQDQDQDKNIQSILVGLKTAPVVPHQSFSSSHKHTPKPISISQFIPSSSKRSNRISKPNPKYISSTHPRQSFPSVQKRTGKRKRNDSSSSDTSVKYSRKNQDGPSSSRTPKKHDISPEFFEKPQKFFQQCIQEIKKHLHSTHKTDSIMKTYINHLDPTHLSRSDKQIILNMYFNLPFSS